MEDDDVAAAGWEGREKPLCGLFCASSVFALGKTGWARGGVAVGAGEGVVEAVCVCAGVVVGAADGGVVCCVPKV